MLIVEKISKVYKSKKGQKTKALENVSFNLPKKGLFFILGKSGSGKSTLLNILGGLDKYDKGNIIIDGKSTKKFRSKDFDYYRNTYIGFIFQEFNLLEEYDVYDNILISTKLQHKKTSKVDLDNILKKVDMEGLGKRKVNELSGGQKQRTAIARALIKNPQIILADEPTGSLDEETGKQIFRLLKEISQDKLVIVVSHDRDSAITYADGIIELKDGQVISNNVPIVYVDDHFFKSKKSKLPFLSSLKFSLLNLFAKKIKLIFTIILIAMSLIFFGTSKVLSHFDIEESYANTMVDTNEEYITINKGTYGDYEKKWFSEGKDIPLLDEDIKFIDSKIDNKLYKKYKLIEDNSLVHFETNYRDFLSKEEKSIYYMMIPNDLSYIESDANFIKNKILGHYPTNYDEVMIHSYFADCLMKMGIALYNDTNSTSFKQEYYYPTSYEELINDGKYFKLGSTKVKISGIILDDTKKYEELKTKSIKEISSFYEDDTYYKLANRNNIYYEFTAKIPNISRDIYVMEGFTNNIKLKKNIVIDNNSYEVRPIIGENGYYTEGTYSYLDKKINIYNGSKYQIIDKLNDNELVITESFLDGISNSKYTKLKNDYLKNYQDKVKTINIENKEIEERNKKKLEEYNEMLENGIEVEYPNLEQLKEFDYKSDEELLSEFVSNYLKENNIMNINLKLNIKNTMYSYKKTYTYDNLKIVGINLNDDTIYMGNNIANEVMHNNSYPTAIMLRSNNAKEIEKIFKNFPLENSKYYNVTSYSNIIIAISQSLNGLSYIAFYASIIFGIFALILLTNFIINSITANKKNIGTLRALGTRKLDTFKIFFNEGLIIGTISLLIAITIIYIEIFYLNNYISSKLFFDIKIVMFKPDNLLILIISVLGIIFLSSLLTVGKITKMKPIDAILNK